MIREDIWTICSFFFSRNFSLYGFIAYFLLKPTYAYPNCYLYLQVCLDRCLDYSSRCPLCIAPLVDDYSDTNLNQSLHQKTVTMFLETAMQRFIPDAYEKRQLQEVEKEPSIPVFICTTAFPFVPCPLFAYESRYRLMIRRAIESGERQFGIVEPHNSRQRYSDFGTMLEIRDCVLLNDGCSILSTVGCRRFRVVGRNDKDGYDTAKIEYIIDEPISKDRLRAVTELQKYVMSKSMIWYNSLPKHTKNEIVTSFGNIPMLESNWATISDGPAWAWYIFAILPLAQPLKVSVFYLQSHIKKT